MIPVTEHPVEERCCDKAKAFAYGVAIIGTFLIVWVLIAAMRHITNPAPIGKPRAEERIKNLKEVQAATQKGLTEYDWSDKPRGMVRIPIEQAMQLTVDEWQDPGAGRSKLLERSAKATAEVKSAFE